MGPSTPTDDQNKETENTTGGSTQTSPISDDFSVSSSDSTDSSAPTTSNDSASMPASDTSSSPSETS